MSNFDMMAITALGTKLTSPIIDTLVSKIARSEDRYPGFLKVDGNEKLGGSGRGQ